MEEDTGGRSLRLRCEGGEAQPNRGSRLQCWPIMAWGSEGGMLLEGPVEEEGPMARHGGPILKNREEGWLRSGCMVEENGRRTSTVLDRVRSSRYFSSACSSSSRSLLRWGVSVFVVLLL